MRGLPLRGLSFAFVIAVVVALLVVLAYGMIGQGRERSSFPVRRRPAPDFTLALYTGGQLSLAELKGKPVVVNFWASWCKPCREEAPILEEGWRKYRERGVVFVGVNFQDDEDEARAFLQKFKITYPTGPDPGHVAVDYGVLGVPETFFIDREGIIVNRFIGPLTRERLADLVEELLR